jgi:uncharacterized protein (TIGR03067 family)
MLGATALLVAVGVLGAAPAPDDNGKDDKLEGTWVATSFIDHGNKLADLANLKVTLILKSGKYFLKVNGQVVDQGTFKVDTSKNPKQLDTTASAGENAGKVDRGLYELKGDVLKTSFDEVTKQKRPDTFDSQKYQVVEFARAKQ